MESLVRKAVFPAAGLGTRFLPATKAQPKEMLPLVDKPIIQYGVEEAVASGIDNIILVTGRGKNAIEDHFDVSVELESFLEARGKRVQLDEIRKISNLINFAYVRQGEPLGLGHAVLVTRELVGNEPFALLLPDVLVQTKGKGCLAQMLDAYAEHGGNIIAVEPVRDDQVKNYGVVSLAGNGDGRVLPIDGMVEKPKPGTAPSNLTILGRYILQPEIFGILSAQEQGAGGEIQITDAMLALLKRQPFYAVKYEGRTFDCGSKVGFLTANVAYALARPDIAEAFKAEIKKLL